MTGIYLVIFIIFIIFRIAGSANKVKNARPGQQGAAPARKPAVGPAKMGGHAIPVTPSGPVNSQPASMNVDPVMPARESAGDQLHGMLDESDRARFDLSEGDSRECDHGSVGGSMDITTHMGQGEAFEHATQQVKTSVKVNVKPSRASQEETNAAARPIPEMSAEEMRRAVVMAEILKRPAERQAGRRWAAR